MLSLYLRFRFILLLFFIFAMHFTMRSPGGYGLYLPFNVVTWMFVSIIIALGLWQISKQKYINYSNFHIISGAGLFLLTLPIFFGSPNAIDALPRLIGLAAGLLMLFAMAQFKTTKEQRLKILGYVVIGVTIEATTGILQLSFPVIGKALPMIIPTSIQPSGVFQQTNVMSSFMATGIILSGYLLGQRQHFLANKYWTPLFCVCIAISSFMLCYIQSKTGIYGLIIGLVFLSPYFITHKNKQLLIALILLTAGSILGGLAKAPLDAPHSKKVIFEAKDVRTDIISVGYNMLKDNPIGGYGYGNFSRQYRQYHLEQMKSDANLPAPLKNLNHPHNEIMLWGIEGGLVSLLGLGLFALAYLTLFSKQHLAKSACFIGLISPLLLHTQTEYPFYHSAVHWLVFLLIINFTLFGCNSILIKKINSTTLVRIMAIIIPLVALPFLLTTLHTGYNVQQYKYSNYQDSSYLNNIINPIAWSEEINFIKQTVAFYQAEDSKNEAGIKQYIEWGSTYVLRKPNEDVYNNLVLAYQLLHENDFSFDEKIALQITLEAQYFHPEKIKWGKH